MDPKLLNTIQFKESIFFVNPDFKRGLGLEDILPDYHIICSYYDPLIRPLRSRGVNILCMEEKGLDGNSYGNTGKLLHSNIVLDYIKRNSKKKPYLMIFKPAKIIDYLVSKNKFNLIGNPAYLNELFENKVSFYEKALKLIPQYLIPSLVAQFDKLKFRSLINRFSTPFIIQFGHGWAGNTTYQISDNKSFNRLQLKFPKTRIKVSKLIKGFVVLNNCCLYNNHLLISPPASQINNIEFLHHNPFVTCGRQWPASNLTTDQIKIINHLSFTIGNLLMKKAYRGIFGIDFIIEEKTGHIFISDVNARFTASIPFYTKLELGINKIPLLAYHISEFMDKKIPLLEKSKKEILGSQLILRCPEFKNLASSKLISGIYHKIKLNLIKNTSAYNPEKLKDDQLLLFKRGGVGVSKDGMEVARLEMKAKVLASPFKLLNEAEFILSILLKI